MTTECLDGEKNGRPPAYSQTINRLWVTQSSKNKFFYVFVDSLVYILIYSHTASGPVYEAVIGLEIHAQISSVTKAFSNARVLFADHQNANVREDDDGDLMYTT